MMAWQSAAVLAIAAGATVLASGTAAAAAEPASPETKNALNIRREFRSGGEKMVGTLFLPTGYQKGQKLPAVVVTGSWTSVKEQMAELYARRLAAKGFVTLAFDFRHWGESGGEPRFYESPSSKTEDIKSAVAFLRTLPEVDGEKIGGLAICASAGYMAHAIADGAPLKSFATSAAWLHNPATVGVFYGGDEGVNRRIALGRAARRKYEQTRQIDYVPAQSATDKDAAMFFPIEYYMSEARGEVPQWTNRFATMGWVDWLTFDALSPAAKISVPTLMVHSDGSALPDNVRRFYADLKGPKRLVWAAGEHTEFYDKDINVSVAVDAAAGHFAETLLPPQQKQSIAETSLAGTREFFAALEAKDLNRFLAIWADDGVQVMPYAPEGFPKILTGKEAIRKQYGGLPENFEYMKFPIRRITATDDPNTVIAEYNGDIKVKATGGKYDNTYVGVFTFENGKLKRYTEYFDPTILAKTFGSNLSRNFNTGGGTSDSTPNQEPPSVAIPRLLERLASAADARDWKTLRAVFADEVDFDYTSVAGGKPATLKADDIVAGWTQGLGRYQQTKHNFSGFDVTANGDTATCRFTGQATHVRSDNGRDIRWSCGGDYEYRLARTPRGWKVTAARFNMRWEQGER